MREVVHTFQDETPRFREGKWKQVFDKQGGIGIDPLAPKFSWPIGEGSVEYEHRLRLDAIWSRLKTLSQIVILEGDELEKVKRAFFDAAETEQADQDGRIAAHGRTYFFWTSRLPDESSGSGG